MRKVKLNELYNTVFLCVCIQQKFNSLQLDCSNASCKFQFSSTTQFKTLTSSDQGSQAESTILNIFSVPS